MKLKKIYNYIDLKDNCVIIDHSEQPAILAKHSIWVPDLMLKFPFQYKQKVIEYRDVELGVHWPKIKDGTWATEKDAKRESFFNIIEEYEMFRLLAEKGYSPAVNNFFYIKNIISNFPLYKGKRYRDNCGALGFYIDDATTYPVKEFSRKDFERDFIETNIIKASTSALNDITMIKRNNLIHGYLVDVRRSRHDAVHLNNHSDTINKLYKTVDNFLEEINAGSKITTKRKD